MQLQKETDIPWP